jgi:hypothetical protein
MKYLKTFLESQGNYSQVANNLKALQHTNIPNGVVNKKPLLDGELIDEEDADIEIPYDMETTGHIGTSIKNIRMRKNSKEPRK